MDQPQSYQQLSTETCQDFSLMFVLAYFSSLYSCVLIPLPLELILQSDTM